MRHEQLEEIYDIIDDLGSCRIADIVEHTDIGRVTVQKIVKQLERLDRVLATKRSRSYYYVTLANRRDEDYPQPARSRDLPGLPGLPESLRPIVSAVGFDGVSQREMENRLGVGVNDDSLNWNLQILKSLGYLRMVNGLWMRGPKCYVDQEEAVIVPPARERVVTAPEPIIVPPARATASPERETEPVPSSSPTVSERAEKVAQAFVEMRNTIAKLERAIDDEKSARIAAERELETILSAVEMAA